MATRGAQTAWVIILALACLAPCFAQETPAEQTAPELQRDGEGPAPPEESAAPAEPEGPVEPPSYVRERHQKPQPEPPAPRKPRVAVFPFGNQTIDPGLGFMELGFREILQGFVEANSGIDAVTLGGGDRAIRRHGRNPNAFVPLEAIGPIARELGCDFAVGGFFYNLQTEMALRGVIFRVTKGIDEFHWPMDALFTNTADAIDAARQLADRLNFTISTQATQGPCEFFVGQRAKIRVIADADRATLSWLDPAGVWTSGIRYRVIEGRQVSVVEFAPATDGSPATLTVANAHPEGSRRRAVIDVWLVMRTDFDAFALRVDKVGEGTVALEVYNENVPGDPKLTKKLEVNAWTTSSDFRLEFAPLRRNGPVYVVARAFGPEQGSVPLAQPPRLPGPETPIEPLPEPDGGEPPAEQPEA